MRLLRERLSEMDIRAYMLRQRENTAWKPWCVTKVNVEIYKTSFPLGHLLCPLPSYITKSKSIISFVRHANSMRPFNDSHCFFRCLAYHKKQSIYMETLCKKLFSQWVAYVKADNLKSTDITLRRIPDLEKCFNINIHIYLLTETGAAISQYKSQECILNAENKKDVMYLNMYENHLCYITNFSAYCKKVQCKICCKLFSNKHKCTLHERNCKAKNENKVSWWILQFTKDRVRKT